MKNTKIITVSLAAVLAIGAITANGVLVSADAEKGTIKVAASATPHAEILEEAKPILEKEGWDLEVTVFDDYVQPNLVVESGDFDANYFQHIPYLDNFNEEQGTHLVNAGGIHYEPFGIYPGTKKSLDELEDGDTIAVPNDTTNATSSLTRETCAASSSSILIFFGFSSISFTVASSPAPSFSVITPLSWRRRSALASFVVSFGTAMVSPSSSSSSDFFVPG